MPKRKNRKLWLEIKYKAPGASDETVKQTLIRSIENGSYEYPESWKVGIFWRNKIGVPMKQGEFSREMRKSSQSSDGWDKAVLHYLKAR